ncbi:hypothetical protein LSCM1_04178 [Leishmania martiniquensis]|uniref:Uncharacterized protein n=1 Tax=Leishmania martiniquensis TaxID=1580590 RepID=A0A836HET8_9TRYP|nr:hypothetical protein LSCM1_04178 [Leishmania martiniquensis]
MKGTSFPAQLVEELSAIEKQRQERLLACTIAEGSLSLLMLEENLRRERLEQLRRHERSLIELSTLPPGSAPDSAWHSTNTELLTSSLSVEEPLSWEVVDRLSEEDVERIWQRERRALEQTIAKVRKRVRKLQRSKVRP